MSYDVEVSRLRCALASTVRDGVGRTVIDHARSPSENEAGRRGSQQSTHNKMTQILRNDTDSNHQVKPERWRAQVYRGQRTALTQIAALCQKWSQIRPFKA